MLRLTRLCKTRINYGSVLLQKPNPNRSQVKPKNHIVDPENGDKLADISEISKQDLGQGQGPDQPVQPTLGARDQLAAFATERHPIKKRLINIGALASILAVFSYWVYHSKKNKFEAAQATNLTKQERAKQHFEKMENLDIGQHDFNLINCKDLNGPRITQSSFKGKWHLVYFGFTHCPDICPSELEKMTDVLTILDEDPYDDEDRYNQIVPVFITIDPSRDPPENILQYLKDYHPRYLALTGSDEDILNAAKGMRVYYTKGPVDADGDYILDHTLITYLISPDGELFDYYGTTKYKPSQLVKMIKEKIDFWHVYH